MKRPHQRYVKVGLILAGFAGSLAVPALVSAEEILKMPELRVGGGVPLRKIGAFPMLHPRFAPAVATQGDDIYIVGGAGENEMVLKSIEKFNIKTGKSTEFATLKIARLWHRAVIVGDRLFVFGGRAPTTRSASDRSKPTFGPTDPYVDKLRQSDLQRAENRYQEALKNRNPSMDEKVVETWNGLRMENTYEVFDINSGERIGEGKMPDSRANFGCVTIGGKIFIMGGSHPVTSPGGKQEQLSFTNRVSIFDVATNTWSDGVSLPEAVECDAVVVTGPFIVVTGGYDGTRMSDGVYAFNPTTAKWNSLKALDRASSAHSTVFLGKYLFLFGNYEHPEEIQIYDLKTRSSETFTLGYAPARHGGAIVADEKIYVCGGKPKRYSTPLDSVQVFEMISATQPKPANAAK